MRNMHRANEFDAPCAKCGHIVAAGDGKLMATRDPSHLRNRKLEWKVIHRKKKCKTPENKND